MNLRLKLKIENNLEKKEKNNINIDETIGNYSPYELTTQLSNQSFMWLLFVFFVIFVWQHCHCDSTRVKLHAHSFFFSSTSNQIETSGLFSFEYGE